jgi:trans-aconitate 2-methyltransferase
MSWNPEQYERFRDERKKPFRDLIALVEHRPHMRIADLGCGTGDLTRELHEHFAASETIGIDNSETMLLKAGSFGGDMLHFERGDIEAFIADQPFDLIFSNAALHWVPDHRSLFRKLASFLSERGQIAVQMPAQDSHPSHAIAAEVAREFGVEPRHDPMLPVEEYASLLFAIGFKRQHVRLQVYGHELASTAAVIEWVKGSLLTDYEKKLGPRFPEFLKQYSSRFLAAVGDHTPYLYTYKRILAWGTF